MPNSINNILLEFNRQVQELLGERLKKIILYGSYARGDYNEKSDVDIMILTDFSEKEIEEYRDKISDIAFELELENDILLSPIVKNEDKYNIRTTYIPFYSNVKKEGVVLVG